MRLREFWTPTRVLRNRHDHWRSYPLLPNDLLAYDEEAGEWVKEAPGDVISGFRIDVLWDDLSAVRVLWDDDTRTYLFVPTAVDFETAVRLGAVEPPPAPRDAFGRKLVGHWEWTRGRGWVWVTTVKEESSD